ncbi:MAG: TonB-dependent siderophore receptor [Lyngbya sp. HA4199-MV5]|nr:TonB-dependent siderophore receptor [Lyngbya sp. HA4199-MV5]
MKSLHLGLGVPNDLGVRCAIVSLLLVSLAGLASSRVEARETPVRKTATVWTRVRDFNRPATTLKEWEAKLEHAKLLTQNAPVTVTSVQLNRAEDGLDITLETADSEPLQVDATKFRAEGKSLVADIPNAVLALPNAQEFSADNPTSEIAAVRVTQTDASTIRVSVIGTTALPTSDVTLKVGRLAYSLNAEGQTPEEELVVTGAGQGSYRVPDATTATRTDTPLRDIPQSIQVIPQQVIRDQGITRITDATRNVSGTTIASGYGNLIGDVRVRSFSSGFLRDGIATQPFFVDGGNIERVEVLKGPASVLYGALEPGGIVNYVTKQPLRTPYYAADFTAGSFDFYKGQIDLTGPVTKDERLLYRLNVSYENSGSFRDFIDNDIFFIAPVVTYRFSDSTNLTFAYEHLNAKLGFDRGLRPVPEFLKVRRSLNIGEPDDFQNNEEDRINLTLNHRFNQNLRIRSAFLYLAENYDSLVTQPGELAADGRTLLDRSYFGGSTHVDNYALQTDLIGDFNTGSVAHQLLAGLELRRRNQADNGIEGVYEGSLDIFNPVYGLPRIPDPDVFFEQTNDTIGIYLQDQVTLRSNLKLLVGGRYDFIWYDTKFIADTSIDSDPDRTNFYDGAFSPRVGIVYQPIEPISLYASYSRSFSPNNSRTANGEALEPSRGTQFEVGVKAELFDKRLSATLAAYDITKTNIPTTDPNDEQFSIAVGEVKSRGIDLDIAGEISPGWKVIASAYLNDAFVSEDNNLPEGRRLTNAPTHGASLWTTYEFQRGGLKGFGFGGGLFFVGDRTANIDDPLILPSYVRFDAALFYKWNNGRVALNFKNLGNVKYYESNDFLVFPQAPFTVQGTVSVSF